LEGEIAVAGDPLGRSLVRGDTILIPAAVDAVTLIPAQPSVFLDAYLP
jgi:hypothetical protein